MQSVGHFIAHNVQTWQYLKSNIRATLPIFQILAAFGQISAHFPHPIHLSSSTKICNMNNLPHYNFKVATDMALNPM